MTTAEVWIPLTQGKVTVIDFEDFEKVRGTKWQARRGRGNNWYAERTGKKRSRFSLHRFLMNAGPGEMVDHKDQDGLNNRRRDNLRFVTRPQNAQNSRKPSGGASRFKGVSRCRDKWNARIWVNLKQISLGCFENETEAAKAYDTAAVKFFGEYASPNFPKEISK